MFSSSDLYFPTFVAYCHSSECKGKPWLDIKLQPSIQKTQLAPYKINHVPVSLETYLLAHSILRLEHRFIILKIRCNTKTTTTTSLTLIPPIHNPFILNWLLQVQHGIPYLCLPSALHPPTPIDPSTSIATALHSAHLSHIPFGSLSIEQGLDRLVYLF